MACISLRPALVWPPSDGGAPVPKSIRVPLAVLLAVSLVAGCGGKKDESPHFYAAASLTDVAQELVETWLENGGEVVPVLASSSTLARQIREGAPAALFLPANQQWMDYLVRETERVISSSRLDLLGNRLALIVPPGNPADVSEIADLTGRGVRDIALGDPEHVPAGIYAAAWLEAAALWPKVMGKLRPAGDVRAALAWVERGEVDAGLVYLTDARIGDVEVVALLDPALIPPIRYPLALIAPEDSGVPTEAALAFHRWLQGDEASAIFSRHGFQPLAARSYHGS